MSRDTVIAEVAKAFQDFIGDYKPPNLDQVITEMDAEYSSLPTKELSRKFRSWLNGLESEQIGRKREPSPASLPDSEGWWWEWSEDEWLLQSIYKPHASNTMWRWHGETPNEKCKPGHWLKANPPPAPRGETAVEILQPRDPELLAMLDATSPKTLGEMETWCKNMLRKIADFRAGKGVPLKEALDAMGGETPCDHEWVSAVNQHVTSGEVCTKCHSLRCDDGRVIQAAPSEPQAGKERRQKAREEFAEYLSQGLFLDGKGS